MTTYSAQDLSSGEFLGLPPQLPAVPMANPPILSQEKLSAQQVGSPQPVTSPPPSPLWQRGKTALRWASITACVVPAIQAAVTAAYKDLDAGTAFRYYYTPGALAPACAVPALSAALVVDLAHLFWPIVPPNPPRGELHPVADLIFESAILIGMVISFVTIETLVPCIQHQHRVGLSCHDTFVARTGFISSLMFIRAFILAAAAVETRQWWKTHTRLASVHDGHSSSPGVVVTGPHVTTVEGTVVKQASEQNRDSH